LLTKINYFFFAKLIRQTGNVLGQQRLNHFALLRGAGLKLRMFGGGQLKIDALRAGLVGQAGEGGCLVAPSVWAVGRESVYVFICCPNSLNY
jgi:hypothetical protein